MKKRILFIGTGGTIASEMSDEGLLPGVGASALLGYVPDVAELCEAESVQLFELDSTNIGPDEWLEMARTVRRNYSRFDGFVISHGTDTMAYTAAALSYLIQRSPKPIILTGAQKPIGFDTTDSRARTCATPLPAPATAAYTGSASSSTAGSSSAHRARKTHSKSFDAFSSINYPNIAAVRDGPHPALHRAGAPAGAEVLRRARHPRGAFEAHPRHGAGAAGVHAPPLPGAGHRELSASADCRSAEVCTPW